MGARWMWFAVCPNGHEYSNFSGGADPCYECEATDPVVVIDCPHWGIDEDCYCAESAREIAKKQRNEEETTKLDEDDEDWMRQFEHSGDAAMYNLREDMLRQKANRKYVKQLEIALRKACKMLEDYIHDELDGTSGIESHLNRVKELRSTIKKGIK